MMKKKKLVCGFGVNDADYSIAPRVNGKQQLCPFYTTWTNMLKRCYYPIEQTKKPTYIDCSVVSEWHSLMAFKRWMETLDWRGNELDKDVLCLGNKIYGPDTCCFVSHAVNSLLTDREAARGNYPQGVYLDKQRQKFHAQIKINGSAKHLGRFTSPKDAHNAYCKAKSEYIAQHALAQSDPRIRSGLLKHAKIFLDKPEKEEIT